MRPSFWTLLPLLAAAVAMAADAPGAAPAVECSIRGGLPNVLAKLDAGGEVRVAYIGGSITAADGWRGLVSAHLRQQWPKAKVTEINAAIGGTGSDLGVFRFRRDVLEQKPDLIFVEFAVNDGGASPESIHRCMEGMVRQAWRDNPAIDICFVYTTVAGWANDLAAGKLPRSAVAMEQIAGHYGIPSICMALDAARLAKEGKLVMTANPKTDEEKAALKDKMIFSADGVHPHKDTGHRLYTEAVARSIEKMKGVGAAGPHKLADAFAANNYEKARMLPISQARLGDGWTKLDMQQDKLVRGFARYLPEMYVVRAPGNGLTVKFRGTMLGFIDLLGPDCGQVVVSVDGGKETLVPRFDAYCTYHRIASFSAARDVADGEHTVTVKVSPAALDKAAILAKLSNKIDNPTRFDGTSWYVGWIMVVGDVVE